MRVHAPLGAAMTGGVSYFLEGAEMDAIWLPTDVYWDESLTVKASGGEAGALFVYPTGLVWWSRQMSFEMMCRDMSFHDFPYDTHHCPFLMGLYSYTATDVVLKWKDGETALAMALHCARNEAAQLLIAHGAEKPQAAGQGGEGSLPSSPTR